MHEKYAHSSVEMCLENVCFAEYHEFCHDKKLGKHLAEFFLLLDVTTGRKRKQTKIGALPRISLTLKRRRKLQQEFAPVEFLPNSQGQKKCWNLFSKNERASW